jgi:hypothetical protein
MKKHVSKPIEVGVIKSTAVFILFIWISFLHVHAQTQNFNYVSFKTSLRDTVILSKKDSLEVIKHLSGDFDKYYNYRLKIKREIIESYSWDRASFYLNKPIKEVKAYAKELKIDSPYYLVAFVSDTQIKHPLKKEIISDLKNSFYEIKKDSSVYNLEGVGLLNAFFTIRMKPRSEKQHKLIYQIKNKPDIALIEQVFLVKQDDLKPEMRQDSSQLKQIIMKPFADEKSFDDLMELSKIRYKAMYPDKKDVSDMNSYRYYLYRINDYSFNAVGGYGLE